jgi:hypothetical protein
VAPHIFKELLVRFSFPPCLLSPTITPVLPTSHPHNTSLSAFYLTRRNLRLASRLQSRTHPYFGVLRCSSSRSRLLGGLLPSISLVAILRPLPPAFLPLTKLMSDRLGGCMRWLAPFNVNAPILSLEAGHMMYTISCTLSCVLSLCTVCVHINPLGTALGGFTVTLRPFWVVCPLSIHPFASLTDLDTCWPRLRTMLACQGRWCPWDSGSVGAWESVTGAGSWMVEVCYTMYNM